MSLADLFKFLYEELKMLIRCFWFFYRCKEAFSREAAQRIYSKYSMFNQT